MSKQELAAPELAAIEVEGMTRSSFILRGALAAGAVYGGSVVGPYVSQAFAQSSGGSSGGGGGDVDILNFALTLEYLEAAFYQRALQQVKGMSSDVKNLTQELQMNESEHVSTLMKTIQQLGGKPVSQPKVSFGNGLSSEKSFLDLAGTFEPVGVGAYNGAAPMIQSKQLLAAAGSIVQVEGRHVGLIQLARGQKITPSGAFSRSLQKQQVLQAVKPFIKG